MYVKKKRIIFPYFPTREEIRINLYRYFKIIKLNLWAIVRNKNYGNL